MFAVKGDGRHKTRLVTAGLLTSEPTENVYSGLVSLRNIRLVQTVELRFSWECVLSHTWISPWTQKGILLCGLDPRKRSITYMVMNDETSV